jgi:UDP-2,4-diacetamido-2,4,6-trideoxy-beta-L-altropyranose hydrolase
MSNSSQGLTALFRVDASVDIGGGHVRRCLSLAQALRDTSWQVAFVSRSGTEDVVPSLRRSGVKTLIIDGDADEPASIFKQVPAGCDLLVVDHYGSGADLEKACRGWARKILVIDDLVNRPHDCDLLVDQTPGRQAAEYRGLVPTYCQILAGSTFALLDRRFALRHAQMRNRSGKVERILVNFGATDPCGATQLALAVLSQAGLGIAIDVVLGSQTPNCTRIVRWATGLAPAVTVHIDVDDMAGLIERCDFAIGAGGVSAIERCCLGLPSIIVILADNQRANADALTVLGAAKAIGIEILNDTERFSRLLTELIDDRQQLAAMSKAAAKVTDGLGAMRVSANCRTGIVMPASIKN